MKTKYLILVPILTMASLHADDLTTRDGKVYHGYKVLGHDAGYLTILYSDGGGKIPLSNLSDDMQKQYGYNKAQADAFIQNSTQADRQAKAAIAEERRAEAQRKAAAASGAPAPVQEVAVVAPAQASASPGAGKPAALTKDEIDEIKAKIKELNADIAFMNREEARIHPTASVGGMATAATGTVSASNGAYADKIQDETDQVTALKMQLEQDAARNPH